MTSVDSEKPTATVLPLRSGKLEVPPDPLAELYLRYRRDVVDFVRRKFGSGPPEPEDVAQAVFLQLAAQHRPELIQNPRSFLLKSAQNLVLDHYRRNARPKHHVDALEHPAQNYLSDVDSERVVTGKERLNMLMDVIAKLPADKRCMVILSRFHGLSCDAIGQRLGLSGEAVQKQIERVLKECLATLRSREAIEADGGQALAVLRKGKAQDGA